MIELTKTCKCCNKDKSFDSYNRAPRYKWGFKSYCKDCENRKSRETYSKNTDYNKERSKTYRLNNLDKEKKRSKLYAQNNKENIASNRKKYRELNWDLVRNREKKYYQNNSHKWVHYNKIRESLKKERLPKWTTPSDIKIIECYYSLASRLSSCLSILHHVDHIIPLQGAMVSGLHTPLNLEVIPAKLNLQKGNKWQTY